MRLQRCEHAVPKFLGNPAVPSTSPALAALEQQWGFLGVSLATSPRVHKACKSAEVVSCRAGEVRNQLQGGQSAEAECVRAKAFPLPQWGIAILLLVVFSW